MNHYQPFYPESMQSLAHAIRKDPISWENWMCLHFSFERRVNDEELDDFPSSKLESLTHVTLNHKDCSIYFCEAGNIMIMTRDTKVSELHSLAQEIEDLLHTHNYKQTEHHVYN